MWNCGCSVDFQTEENLFTQIHHIHKNTLYGSLTHNAKKRRVDESICNYGIDGRLVPASIKSSAKEIDEGSVSKVETSENES